MKRAKDRKFMHLAIYKAKEGARKLWGGPFGACLVKNGKVLAVTHNSVLKDRDPSAHAEMNAIRKAAQKLKSFDLSGCVIYSTTEPCPMCFAAIHWARLDRVKYGTSIQDVAKRGFNELSISNHLMKRLGKSKVSIQKSVSLKECQVLLRFWDQLSFKITY
ncbi:MAG: nucleoside deaminase [Candidatus Omnitrophica bacterium]|nr:nucleoside deaminase [Candidatus Omnitrophota bacterium]